MPDPSPPCAWFARTQALALTLTSWPSVTGTDGEVAFAHRLHALVSAWPYFQAYPAHVWTAPAPHTRAHNVYLLVRGQGPGTALLSGHYDTVDTAAYGDLEALAHQPEALRAALITSLQRPDLNSAERLALQDLDSGDFLPGRGLLDMKGGLAAGLAVLERYAALPEDQRPSHLLLVASPDEERLSGGARGAVHDLPAVTAQHGLKIHLGINLDATNDLQDGQSGRAAYLGTVGKLLVTALVIGRPTHASYPYDGMSAALLAAELVRAVEADPALADHAHGETAPPPSCLELRDCRTGYDVTTPAALWCAFSVFTHQRSSREVLTAMLHLAHRAADEATARFAAHAHNWGSATADQLAGQACAVLTFADVRARAAARMGEDAVRQLVARVPAVPDPLLASRTITQTLAVWAQLSGPAIVLGFAGLAYPHAHVRDLDPAGEVEAWLHAHLRDFGQQIGEQVVIRPFFAGISDLSFLGRGPEAEGVVAQHTPHPEHVHAGEGGVTFPTLNLGPWGRDYHQKLERVHQPYAFSVLPALLWQLTRAPFVPSACPIE